MPTSAIAKVDVDSVLPLRQIGRELTMCVATGEEATTPNDATIPETDLELLELTNHPPEVEARAG